MINKILIIFFKLLFKKIGNYNIIAFSVFNLKKI